MVVFVFPVVVVVVCEPLVVVVFPVFTVVPVAVGSTIGFTGVTFVAPVVVLGNAFSNPVKKSSVVGELALAEKSTETKENVVIPVMLRATISFLEKREYMEVNYGAGVAVVPLAAF